MNRPPANTKIYFGGLLGLFLLAGLLCSTPALAGFEQVKPPPPGAFEDPAGEALLRRTAVAVNNTGVGEVEPGTVYVSGIFGTKGVHRYDAEGVFQGRWGGFEALGVAVSQSTGCVYVFTPARANAVSVFNADGSNELATFGQVATPGESISSSPEKFHEESGSDGGLAVDSTGNVYISDRSGAGAESRIMVFKPESAGDCEHYSYAGQGSDIAAGQQPRQLTTDEAGNLYAVMGPGRSKIQEFATAEPSAPVCKFELGAGGIVGLSVNSATGQVFFSFETDKKKGIQLLEPCGEDGAFKEGQPIAAQPKPGEPLTGLAVNPTLVWAAGRPAGVLYAVPSSVNAVEPSYIFAPAVSHEPVVESESVGNVTATSATLNAAINPEGATTRYTFQSIDEASYQANEPDERQALTVKAGGGLFGLSFEGANLGGPALGTLSSGSATVSALKTVTATATLKAAKGSGQLNGAKGKGTVISGSETITSVTTSEGEFEIGQGISGEGIPTGTTITAVATEAPLSTKEVTISATATKSVAHTSVTAGTKTITSLTTNEGEFEAGQVISGPGIFEKTTILTASPTELTLSKPVAGPATGVALKAGSTKLTSVVGGIGSFEVGSSIQGEGIPSNTKVTAVGSGELTLSSPVEKPGSSVALSSPGPYPLAVGEGIEGPGLAPGTTIASIGVGQLTLSNPASASGTNVALKAGLPAGVSARGLRRALEGLSTIGPRGVEVIGGPGDETGSSPYDITFTGALENVDALELSATNLSLSGGLATVAVQTLHDGGNGFASGAVETPFGGALLGTGQTALPAAVSLSGLDPDTGYRFRVVVSSNEGADKGETESFRTYAVQVEGPPDGRVYELVSPTRKNGGEVFPLNPSISSCDEECKPGSVLPHLPVQSAVNGDGLAYEGFPFSTTGAPKVDEYLSTRTAAGWQTTNPTPPSYLEHPHTGYFAFSGDLANGVFAGDDGASLASEAPAGYPNFFLQAPASPTVFSPLLKEAPPNRPPGESLHLEYAASTEDLSHVLFSGNDALTRPTPFAPEANGEDATKNNLYEWAGGQLRLVNVLPNGETIPGAAFGSGAKLSEEKTDLHFQGVDFSNAISADGSRIFWSSAKSGQVYVRINGEETVEVLDKGQFVTASADGSTVLLSDGCLYELRAESCTDLNGNEEGFEGILGQSDDLSSIYFVDTAALTSVAEENANGEHAAAGENNFYSWQDGSLSFVATLAQEDEGNWTIAPIRRNAQASPDGRWLAFLSQLPLTGADNIGPCLGKSPNLLPGPCPEAFILDASSGELTCVSCDSSGEAPLGPTFLPTLATTSFSPLLQPRFLTDSGRLFFDTRDSLSPFDTNVNAEDVYEYEPQGVGSCQRVDGCTSLVSAGQEPIDSNFLAIDPASKNVFFTTRDRLVPADRDGLIDVYDAREGGGIPEEQVPGECEGESCQPLPQAPTDQVPGSLGFQGPGNVKQGGRKKHHKHHVKHHRKKRRHGHKARHRQQAPIVAGERGGAR